MIVLRVSLASQYPDELSLVAEEVDEAAEDDRVALVVSLEDIVCTPERPAIAKLDLEPALVGVTAEARETYRLFQLRVILWLRLLRRLRVDYADAAVAPQRVLGDYVLSAFEGRVFRPVGLIPSAEIVMWLEVGLDASDRIEDLANRLNKVKAGLLSNLLVHVVVDHGVLVLCRRNLEVSVVLIQPKLGREGVVHLSQI